MPRSDAESVVSAAPADPDAAAPGAATAAADSGATELYWAPALLAAVLVLVELYLVLREFRRTRLTTTSVIA